MAVARRAGVLLPLRAPVLCAALAPAVAAAPGDVLVVAQDSPPPGAFASIQAAVDAALDGDVVLVKGSLTEGQYESFSIDGKAIAVVAVPCGTCTVTVAGGPRIANVPQGKRVLLAGLATVGVAQSELSATRGLTLTSNSGSVRIEDCNLTGGAHVLDMTPPCPLLHGGEGFEGVFVEDSSDVVFAGSDVRGGEAAVECTLISTAPRGGHGLQASDSRISFFDGALIGGEGGAGIEGGIGGDGVQLGGGHLHVSNALIVGGRGGLGVDDWFSPGGAGGPGLSVLGGGVATALDSEFVGGLGGPGCLWGQVVHGPAGPPWSGSAPTLYPAAACSLDLASPVRELQSAAAAFAGEPGAIAFVLAGGLDGALPLPELQGVLHALDAPQVLVAGVLDPQGQLELAFPIGPLPPGEQALVVPVQGAVLTPGLELVLASARHLVIVHAGV